MPTANIYYTREEHKKILKEIALKLKPYLAEKLTCGEIKLKENEISVRLINTDGTGMIGNVEIEITAFAFPERIEKQDKICLEVRDYIQENYPSLREVKVWLILAELGHSWEQ
jgi:hypothetical protein